MNFWDVKHKKIPTIQALANEEFLKLPPPRGKKQGDLLNTNTLKVS